MTEGETTLDRLAAELGIAPGYHDIDGGWHEASREAKQALVAAMGGRRPDRAPGAAPVGGPARCHLPPSLTRGARVWGFAVQLYALRSSRNWGIGDFGDLGRFVALAAGLGAGAVQINPLHALFPCWPDHISPYAPSSRLFLNPIYIDIEALADYRECADAKSMVGSPAFQAALEKLRSSDLVDYTVVATRKMRVLRLVYEGFRKRHLDGAASERGAAFRAFQSEQGGAIADFAVFEALSAHFSHDSGPWQRWPEEYRAPHSRAVQEFAAGDRAASVEFSVWLQWLALQQLHGVSALAGDLGMEIGLIADLAIGNSAAGADVWCDQSAFALDVELGAPPDPFNDKGQTWGVVPWQPWELRARGCQPLAMVVRAAMRWAGGIRIDHAMGLERQFWVPRGRTGLEGAYVAYPREELLAAVARESIDHRCLVIGEDLGTVPEGFRERMAKANALSTRVLYFECGPDGRFRRPEEYPYLAAVSASTHDLPTVPGFFDGFDLKTRSAMGYYRTSSEEQAAHEQRAAAIAELVGTLRSEGLLPANSGRSSMPSVSEACQAIHGFLARSSSAVALVQLEDALGMVEQANVPGTTEAYPNWRRKLRLPLEDLENCPGFATLAALMTERRASASKS